MQYRPPNANQEVSNTNHFRFVSDSLGQLAAVSECMASWITLLRCNQVIADEHLPEYTFDVQAELQDELSALLHDLWHSTVAPPTLVLHRIPQ